jgi:nucleotide-binding universal stress UspA family protein
VRKLEHIAVAFDGSAEAERGFAFAAWLAERTGARVTALQVIEPAYDVWASVPEPVPGLEEMLRRHEDACAEQLAALAATAPPGVSVETELLQGKPAETLLEALGKLAPDLAIAGTHGVGFSRFLLGSVSARLLEASPCDLLLVRGDLDVERPPSVIAAIDESDQARHALEVATGLTAALSTRLVLAHVVDDSIPFAVGGELHGVREALHTHGERVLSDAREQMVAPSEAVVDDLRQGSPSPQLIAACEDHQPAIVVVGTRGAHGFHGLLTGSTARNLVNHAPCPVLVVHNTG